MMHLCHVSGCNVRVNPNKLMCSQHWQQVPLRLQYRVWQYYRPGQELDKQPTHDYIDAAKAAIAASQGVLG